MFPLRRRTNEVGRISREKVLSRMHRKDREFLPAALEILETPPSPIASALISLLFLLMVTSLAWASISNFDIVVVSRGKIQPEGRIKVIQPLDSGKIRDLRVSNGQLVFSGEVLAKLDDTELIADERALNDALFAWRAESIRRTAAISVAKSKLFEVVEGLSWPSDIPILLRGREDRIYESEITQLSGKVSSIRAQEREREASILRMKSTIEAQTSLVETLQSRVNMKSDLVKNSTGTKVSLIDAVESLKTEVTKLTDEKGQLEELYANANVLSLEVKTVIDLFVADNAQKLSEAERQIDDLTQRLSKARARRAYTELRSPIDGTVTGLTVTTVGQVVGSGVEVMRIVPSDSVLEVEAYVQNQDIGFIKVGQSAVIKIDAFPFTRYGSIDAVVTKVNTDAIPEQDASATEEDGTRSSRVTDRFGAQRVQNLVYPITLRLTQNYLEVDDGQVPARSGMTVSAEILTGKRKAIEYLMAPVVEVGSNALRER